MNLIKKIITIIINFFKLIIFYIIKFITSLFGIENKNIKKPTLTSEERATTVVTTTKKDNITTIEESNRDDISTKEISSTYKLPFTDKELDKVFNDVLESEYDIKVKYLEYTLKDEVEKLKIKLIPKIKEEVEYKDIYRKPSLVDLTKKIIDKELEEKPIKELESKKKKTNIKDEIYIIATPIDKKLNLNNKVQKVTQIPIEDDLPKAKEDTIKKEIEEKPFIVTPIVEVTPKIKLKDELATAIKASAVVMAGVATELLTEDKKEEKSKEEIKIEIKLNPEKETPKIKEIVTKKEEEENKDLKKEEPIKEVIPTLNLSPVIKEEEKIKEDLEKEKKKENIEEKEYDKVENKINTLLESLEEFKIKNEKELSNEQKEKIEEEQTKLRDIKDNIEISKDFDIEEEKKHLEETIKIEEMDGLKKELKRTKIEHQLDLNENLINEVEELDHLTGKQLDDIEKNLIKRKLRRASGIATIASILALPFIKNKYFKFFTAGLLVNTQLLFVHSILRHQSTDMTLPDMNNLRKGKDALNGAINITNENINYLNYLEGEALRRHPSLAKDLEYRNYVSNLRTKLNTSYTKLTRKQNTVEKYIRRTKNNSLRLNRNPYNNRPI